MSIFKDKSDNQKKDLLLKINSMEIEESDINFIKNLYNKDKNFKNNIILIIKSLINSPGNNFSSSFCTIFDFLNEDHLHELISSSTETKISFTNMAKIIKNTNNKDFIFSFLNLIIENNFLYFDAFDFFKETYCNNMLRINLLEKNGIKKFLSFYSLPILSKNEKIKEYFNNNKELIISYRKIIFDDTKKTIINTIENLYNNQKDAPVFQEKLETIISWDLWKYCDTNNEVAVLLKDFYKTILETNYEGTEIFYKINEISNKTFKNLDFKLDNFFNKITDLSNKIYGIENKDKDCDRIVINLDIYDKNIIKEVLWKVYKSFPDKKIDSKNEIIKNRILRILIDEDIKTSDFSKNKKPDGNDINPLDDADEVYNPKNEIEIIEEKTKYLIRKIQNDQKILFIILKNDQEGKQSEIQCDDEEMVTKELLKFQIDNSKIENVLNKLKMLFLFNQSNEIESEKYEINKKSQNKNESINEKMNASLGNLVNEDKEILEIAIDIVKEIKNNLNLEEFHKDKSRIFEIIHEVIVQRRKVEAIKNLKKIINLAIEDAINEKNFEDL